MTDGSLTNLEINAALSLVGAVEPRSGFEQRLLTRLNSAAELKPHSFSPAAARRMLNWAGLPAWQSALAGAVLAAGFAAGIIGLALHKPAAPPPAPPYVQLPASGFGTAAVAHVPSQRIHPATVPGNRRGRATAHTRQSRAVLAVPPARNSGSVPPNSPYQGDALPRP